MITEKTSNEHAHIIMDGQSGELRIDKKDRAPGDLVKSMYGQLELKTGDVVKITRSELKFVDPEKTEPRVNVYTAEKDGYFVLEIYNSGNEDVEGIDVTVKTKQPTGEQNSKISRFNYESEYLVKAKPRSLNVLKRGEKVYAHVVSISTDKKMLVNVKCRGVVSNQIFVKDFELETANQY